MERVTVLCLEEQAPGAYHLSVPRLSDFSPGQCVQVTVAPDIPPRTYSIASGKADGRWDILFDVASGGTLSPRLASLNPGDPVYLSLPFGTFMDAPGPAVWIATGTGIAPFLSMARSGNIAGKALIHGSRKLSGLFFHRFLLSLLGTSYVPCCTSGSAAGVFAGRVTSYLGEGRLDTRRRYLLCGSAEMVVDVRDLLIRRGVPFSRIAAEIYF